MLVEKDTITVYFLCIYHLKNCSNFDLGAKTMQQYC